MSEPLITTPVRASSINDGLPVLQSRRLEHCQFRVLGRHNGLLGNGEPRSEIRLGNLAGSALTHINPLSSAQWWQSLSHGDVISVSGELRAYPDQWEIRIDSAYSPAESALRPAALLPGEWVLPSLKPQLKTVVRDWSNITEAGLRVFLAEIFSNATNAMAFLNTPASSKLYRPYQGGLLSHTAEMLLRFKDKRAKTASAAKRDLITTLILTHSIGNTTTLTGPVRDKNPDRAALELMAQPLARLEAYSPEMAGTIRDYFRPTEPRQDSYLS